MVLVTLKRLPRCHQAGEGETGARATGVAVQAVVVDVRPADDLVARRRLPRETNRVVPPLAVVFRLLAEIRVVIPPGVVAGVLVVPHAGYRLPVVLIAIGAEEPQLVAHDRTAERRVDVPQPDRLQRGREALRFQVGAEVVGHQPAPRAVDEEASGKHVSTLLADDVQLRSAGRRLTKATTEGEHDFLRIADFGRIARDAHALVTGAHAVDEYLSLVPASAVNLEDAEDVSLRPTDVVALHVERGHELRERGIEARRRK